MKTLGNALFTVVLGLLFLLAGCGKKDDPANYSSTGIFYAPNGDAKAGQ